MVSDPNEIVEVRYIYGVSISAAQMISSNDTLDCGNRGCCPEIVCLCGGNGTAVSPDSGCRGMVAVIVNWGSCTTQDTNFR